MRGHELGRRGEQVAAARLRADGWRVVARNVREGRKEVDLVATRGAVVAFVEVKARAGLAYGHPLEAITRAKRREIESVARAWLRRHPQPGRRVRFDAVSVLFRDDGPPLVEHVEDAWRLLP